MKGRSPIIWLSLIAGLVFLYLPMLVLIIYSFNDGKSIAVWSGWSLRWYRTLIENEALLGAAGLSLKLATLSGGIAVVLGTMAACALHRFGAFRGRGMLTALVSGPLVMPEILLGLSLLLLFVTMEQFLGWPAGRGMLTICLAHGTFGLYYVVLVVQARLAGMDHSLEEAAQDLGATPIKVFFTITLPLILPGVISGFLLSFTLSLDDLVIASFVSGPGSSTLPMVVFSKVRLGIDPQINALASLLILAVAIGSGLAFLFGKPKK
jgi:putrescine transport system permease protein